MLSRKPTIARPGGTVWGIPALLFLACISPIPELACLALGTLAVGLLLQQLPYLAVSEARKSFAMASEGKWPQARFYNLLAQQKLRERPWLGGRRLFRTLYQAPTLALSLQADYGRIMLSLGHLKEAKLALRRAVADHPTDAPSHHNLALVHMGQGDLPAARSALGKALSLGFTDPVLGALWRAQVARRPGWRSDPSEESRLRLRISLYQKLGFHEVALRCLPLDSGEQTCWRRTTSLLALGRDQQAWQESLTLLGENPYSSYAWLSLGFVEAMRGDHQAAERAYRQSLRHDPKNLASKEQLYSLQARTRDRQGLLNALAILGEHETNPQHLALGKAFLCAALGSWQATLRAVVAASGAVESPALLELAGYASLQLGQKPSGQRLLHRFVRMAQVSRLPMLDGPERLRRAIVRLRSEREICPRQVRRPT